MVVVISNSLEEVLAVEEDRVVELAVVVDAVDAVARHEYVPVAARHIMTRFDCHCVPLRLVRDTPLYSVLDVQ